MSHEFESGFFVAQAAWHGLGTVLDRPPTTAVALVQAGLDWRVLEEPFYQVGSATGDLVSSQSESNEPVLRKKLVRDRDQALLGIVPPDYVPLQNQDAFRWFDPLLEKGGLELEAAGSLQQGKRVWILARIRQAEAAISGYDWVRPYLLLHNSHDGSTAVWIQFTPIRVVCWNTLHGASANRFGDLWQRKAICLPHSLNLEAQLDRVQNLVDLTQLEFQCSVEEYQAMANQELNQELLTTYFGSVFGSTLGSTFGLPNSTRRSARASVQMSARSIAQTPEWEQFVANFEQGKGNQGKTLWDAYNAITEWIDHQCLGSSSTRLTFSWFGNGVDLRRRAHEAAIALLNQRSTPQFQPVPERRSARLIKC